MDSRGPPPPVPVEDLRSHPLWPVVIALNNRLNNPKKDSEPLLLEDMLQSESDSIVLGKNSDIDEFMVKYIQCQQIYLERMASVELVARDFVQRYVSVLNANVIHNPSNFFALQQSAPAGSGKREYASVEGRLALGPDITGVHFPVQDNIAGDSMRFGLEDFQLSPPPTAFGPTGALDGSVFGLPPLPMQVLTIPPIMSVPPMTTASYGESLHSGQLRRRGGQAGSLPPVRPGPYVLKNPPLPPMRQVSTRSSTYHRDMDSGLSLSKYQQQFQLARQRGHTLDEEIQEISESSSSEEFTESSESEEAVRPKRTYRRKPKPKRIVMQPPKKQPKSIVRRTRENLPKEAKEVLKVWLLKHVDSPYPSEAEKAILSANSGLDIAQINNWFVNARRRILVATAVTGSQKGQRTFDVQSKYDPLLKKQVGRPAKKQRKR